MYEGVSSSSYPSSVVKFQACTSGTQLQLALYDVRANSTSQKLMTSFLLWWQWQPFGAPRYISCQRSSWGYLTCKMDVLIDNVLPKVYIEFYEAPDRSNLRVEYIYIRVKQEGLSFQRKSFSTTTTRNCDHTSPLSESAKRDYEWHFKTKLLRKLKNDALSAAILLKHLQLEWGQHFATCLSKRISMWNDKKFSYFPLWHKWV